jgi:hypothetical protein
MTARDPRGETASPVDELFRQIMSLSDADRQGLIGRMMSEPGAPLYEWGVWVVNLVHRTMRLEKEMAQGPARSDVLGVLRRAVLDLAEEAAELRRKLGGRGATPRHLQRDGEVKRLFLSGMSDQAIAKHFRSQHPEWARTERETPLTAGTIRSIRRKLGVKRLRGQITSSP